jgi:hypothetical protein
VKAEELFEGIQRRTKQHLPRVLKYKNLFFPTGKGWSKKQVLYSMEERITENEHKEGSEPIWHAMYGKRFKPNDISDKDMEQFVLDWDYAGDIESNDRMHFAQEEALENLAKKLLKI